MKKKRHEAILKLIKEFDIETQEELLIRLKESGFNVTQATISRDIKDLKLVKEHFGKNKTRYVISKSETHNNFAMIFSRSVSGARFVRVKIEVIVSLFSTISSITSSFS